ncbi:MAG: hypothetical protein J4F36_12835 [Nitrosopumilaceae archaeon]|nr:hypothetical protein [Nitrosopumilaceae archaeon]
MQFFEITVLEFIEEIKKVLPQWKIEISPLTVMDKNSTDNSVTIVVKNDKESASCTVPLKEPSTPPRHFALLMLNVGNLICKITNEKDQSKYDELISNQISKYFESKRSLWVIVF